MAKYCGMVGYVDVQETAPGVYTEIYDERKYYGEVLSNNRRWENSQNLNDNLTINNRFSIVADAYAYDHFFAMRYIEWMGSYWEITHVEVQRPRLILTVGGVYNGPKKRTADEV